MGATRPSGGDDPFGGSRLRGLHQPGFACDFMGEFPELGQSPSGARGTYVSRFLNSSLRQGAFHLLFLHHLLLAFAARHAAQSGANSAAVSANWSRSARQTLQTLGTCWLGKPCGNAKNQVLTASNSSNATVCELFVVNLVVLLFCFIQMSG